jgi:hypothetical protein
VGCAPPVNAAEIIALRMSSGSRSAAIDRRPGAPSRSSGIGGTGTLDPVGNPMPSVDR